MTDYTYTDYTYIDYSSTPDLNELEEVDVKKFLGSAGSIGVTGVMVLFSVVVLSFLRSKNFRSPAEISKARTVFILDGVGFLFSAIAFVFSACIATLPFFFLGVNETEYYNFNSKSSIDVGIWAFCFVYEDDSFISESCYELKLDLKDCGSEGSFLSEEECTDIFVLRAFTVSLTFFTFAAGFIVAVLFGRQGKFFSPGGFRSIYVFLTTLICACNAIIVYYTVALFDLIKNKDELAFYEFEYGSIFKVIIAIFVLDFISLAIAIVSLYFCLTAGEGVPMGALLSDSEDINNSGADSRRGHPVTDAPAYDEATLPLGWERKTDPKTGRVFYVNHNEHTTSWLHPGLQQ